MSRWLRLYDEVLDDPKVQKLSPELFKIWINLLCLASKHDGILPDAESVSFALRMTFHETNEALKKLVSCGLFDSTKKGLSPHAWSKRQYKSDTSTDRVKRFRQRSRNGQLTVTVTAPETDTEQRQKQIQKQKQNRVKKLTKKAASQAPLSLIAFGVCILEGKARATPPRHGLKPLPRHRLSTSSKNWRNGKAQRAFQRMPSSFHCLQAG